MTALATHVTGLPVNPPVFERDRILERVSLRLESLLLLRECDSETDFR
jgi:hypothetical protein